MSVTYSQLCAKKTVSYADCLLETGAIYHIGYTIYHGH
jgi:hypothetical protein